MKTILLSLIGLTLVTVAQAADVSFKGSYTTQFKNDRPNRIEGSGATNAEGVWEGELTTNWKGTVVPYKGTITGDLEDGEVKGDFRMMQNGKPGRHFVFTAKAKKGSISGKVTEMQGNREVPVGELKLKADKK